MTIMKRAFNFTKMAAKWYLMAAVTTEAITPTGMIPYNFKNINNQHQ